MRKAKGYVLSFIVPLLLLIIVILYKHVLDGKFSMIISDLYGQYYKLLFNFKDVLNGDANIFYSFSKGLGGGMISTYAYYLLSPFNLLLSLFSASNIRIFVTVIILLKISLSGLTMFTYLKYHFKQKDIYLVIFSTIYALSLYSIGNYFQLMWLDAIILAPLVLLGIDKIVKENKSLLYGITLFFSIFSNYYIGYMICVFSVIYFIYRYLLNKPNKKSIKKFIIVSILAGLMTMLINFPNVIATLNGERMTKVYVGVINTDVFGILAKLFIGSHDASNILNIDHPFLYCGIFTLVLLFLYFLNKKISKKEKILSFSILFIFMISIIVSPINYAWHLFSPPNAFNYRYAFLIVLFIIYLACKSFMNIKYLSKKEYLLVGPILPILGLFIYLFTSLPLYLIYVSVGFYLIYILILYNFKNNICKFLFIILSLTEIYFNINIIFTNFDLLYNKYVVGRYNEKNETIEYINTHDNSKFYRMDFSEYSSYTGHASYNDSFAFNYNSASTWLSTLNSRVNFYFKFGYKIGKNAYHYIQYPISDAILGIKYYNTMEENNMYKKIYSHEVSPLDDMFYGINSINHDVYENPYALSLGFMVNDNVLNDINYTNAFESQNEMINEMTNLNLEVYSKEVLIEENGEYYLNIKDDKRIFLLMNVEGKEDRYEYKIFINDQLYATKTHSEINFIEIKNNYKIGEKIKISFITNNVDVKKVAAFSFYEDNFIKHIDYLKEHQLNITEFKDGYVKGTINVSDDYTLFTSIPYEKGWNIYVDGVKTDYYKLYDNFIGLNLESGFHNIEFSYAAPGFKIGLIVSSISLIGFILYEINEHKKKL